MGAAEDATWVTNPDGLEQATGIFSATLHDWGRLGNLLADAGEQIRPLVGDRSSAR